jgi:hypothetical protein
MIYKRILLTVGLAAAPLVAMVSAAEVASNAPPKSATAAGKEPAKESAKEKTKEPEEDRKSVV